MPRHSMHHSSPPNIVIVGGGIASLVAGITLREKLPNARITLYCGDGEKMLGGQLASWDEQGFPVEHGLHALFGFYDNILPLLKKIGAYENLNRSQEHVYIRERGALHRFNLRRWPVSYSGFTALEKVRFLAAVPAIGKLMLDVRRKGMGAFDHYDRYDLRELARMHGVPESVLQSGFFRQFYEAAFNAPSELSATVALQSIYKIFSKPWHYYFNLPTTDSIITPLRRHFTDACRGRIEFDQKLVQVCSDESGSRVTSLVFENQRTRERYSVEADEYVLALGLEGFKQVDFGLTSKHEYFRNVHKLKTVSSFSIQAWFRDDPVPKGLDSMITGMPAPFGILCPITRVRANRPPNLPLSYELIATGPEAGYEDVPDSDIQAGFIQGLKDAGFAIPEDRSHMHIVLRRNRESFHRYLLTRPGELALRPAHQSPLQNLCLAGAWVRNAFALPCVDAAAEGAIKVAELIAARAQAQQRIESRFALSPEGARLVLKPPYHFPRSTGACFLLNANPAALAEAVPSHLRLFPGLGRKILFAALRHEDVYAQHDLSGARYGYNEVLLAAFVREKNAGALGGIGLYPLCLYVDDDTAMAVGREVYGFPKRMAQIDLVGQSMRLIRRGLAPRVTPGAVQPITVMNASWSSNSPDETAEGERAFNAAPLISSRPLGVLAGLISFYNVRHLINPDSHSGVSSSTIQLTKVSLGKVNLERVSALSDLHLQIGASINDPVHRFIATDSDSSVIQVGRGLKVELGFSMDAAKLVGMEDYAREGCVKYRHGVGAAIDIPRAGAAVRHP